MQFPRSRANEPEHGARDRATEADPLNPHVQDRASVRARVAEPDHDVEGRVDLAHEAFDYAKIGNARREHTIRARFPKAISATDARLDRIGRVNRECIRAGRQNERGFAGIDRQRRPNNCIAESDDRTGSTRRVVLHH